MTVRGSRHLPRARLRGAAALACVAALGAAGLAGCSIGNDPAAATGATRRDVFAYFSQNLATPS